MKALSLKQPWATWVAEGLKPIETRTWATKYRGRLLICASKTFDRQAPPDPKGRTEKDFLYGVALCVVDLTDCRPMTPADEAGARIACAPGRFAWLVTVPVFAAAPEVRC